MGRLLEPLRVGELSVRNRMFCAPLTRCRAIHDRMPNALMREPRRPNSAAARVPT